MLQYDIKNINLVTLRRLIAGFSTRRSGFDPRSDHLRFVADKVALGQVFSVYCDFPCQFSFHLLLHILLSFGAGTIGEIVADPNPRN
jgi:hypothetical protein